MDTQSNRSMTSPSSTAMSAVVGILLIAAGIVFLVARFANFDLGQYGWPLFVIVPGIALIALGVASRPVSGLVVPGSIVTVTGLILAVQNTFNLWATWSYAWALIFPGAVGLGTLLLGALRGDGKQRSGGLQAIVAGLGMFAVFGVFFEGILHVSGLNFGVAGDVVLPAVLIAAGLLLLLIRIAGASGNKEVRV